MAQHPALEHFRVVADCLCMGAVPITELARRAGRTPFYAYDRALMTHRVERLRTVLPREIKLHYALKANPMAGVVEHMAALVDGLDVASLGEMRLALDAGARARCVSFAGPGKTDGELAAAVAAGVVISIESEGEMARVARLAEEAGVQPKVTVRVNPDFELKTSGMKMSGGPKAFGVDAERVPDMLARLRELDLAFRGFHIFAGSQNLRAVAVVEAQTRTFELALRLAEHAPAPVRLLNIGGGLGIPYFPADRPLDLGPLAENLAAWTPTVRERLPLAEIVLELGRYLVGEAGIYVCEVVDRKISRGQTFLVTNGGLHHHLAASGNFGQVLRKNYPVAVGNRMNAAEHELVNVVGPSCTPLDVLAQQVELPRADVGDLIVVFQSGAYGLSASPTGFLGHPPPPEVLL